MPPSGPIEKSGRLADAMPDRRDPSRIRHAMFEMVMARVSAIACGHKDAIDLDRLRHDPLMKIARPRRRLELVSVGSRAVSVGAADFNKPG